MNREQRILNHNKRDATRIVSRKPSNSEGNNGDFAVGNTAEGPMLFSKINNKWHSSKPKKNIELSKKQVIKKGENILHIKSQVKHLGTSSTTSLAIGGWLNINEGRGVYTTGEGEDDIPENRNYNIENGGITLQLYASVAKGDAVEAALGASYGTYPAKSYTILCPYDTTIESFIFNSRIQNQTFYTEVFVLPDGDVDWDTNHTDTTVSGYADTLVQSNIWATNHLKRILSPGTYWEGLASSSVFQGVLSSLEGSRVPIPTDYVFRKGSLILFHVTCDTGDFTMPPEQQNPPEDPSWGYSPNMDCNWSLTMKFHPEGFSYD